MEPRKDKLLIAGIDTLAGSNLALTLADRCDVVGLSRWHGFALEGCRTLINRRRTEPGNSLSREHIFVSIVSEQPRWVVYCGPICRSNWDGLAQSETSQATAPLNVTQEATLLTAARQASHQSGAKLILVSTDAVCVGPQVFHSEEQPVFQAAAEARTNPAANAAWQLERQLDLHHELVVRTHLFGWSAMGESYAEQLWMALEDGAAFSASLKPSAMPAQLLSGKHYASPILASDFAELLWAALQRNLSGLFHAGGAERVNQWQFATALAAASGMWLNGAAMNTTRSLHKPATSNLSQCAPETSLDSRKLQRGLNIPLPRFQEGIERFTQQSTSGYRDALRAAFFMNLHEPAAA